MEARPRQERRGSANGGSPNGAMTGPAGKANRR